MKKKCFTAQQIISFLKEAEAGVAVKELCRKHGFPYRETRRCLCAERSGRFDSDC